MDAVLEVDDLTRRFGAVVANDGVDLRVRPGQVVGLLGHNGAGKTTLVSQIVGLLRPDAGTIRVAGIDAVADPGTARRCVALHAQGQAPLDGMTPRTAITLAARLRGLTGKHARAAADRLAADLDIAEWLDRRALPDGAGLSGGVRRLTGFAMAAVAPVPLVILDEPTNDVDAARRRLLWATVRRLADAGAGVLVVTHNVAEAERVLDDLVVLDRGRVVAAGSPSRLRGDRDADLCLEVTLSAEDDDPTASVDEQLRWRHLTRTGRRVRATVPAERAEAAVTWAKQLRTTGRIDGFSLAPTSLEDLYLTATGAAADRTPADRTAKERTDA